MKQYRKLMAFMLGAIMATSNANVVLAEKIENDINGHWGQKSMERWIEAGIIQGDGTKFYPNNNITRAEMAVIVSNLLSLEEQAQNNFVDLENKWYTEAILKCNAAGIMLGDGEKVRPNDPITRQEAAVLIGKMLAIKESQGGTEQFDDSEEVAGWAQGFITSMSELGILTGYDNKIHPSDNISRASVMTMLDRAIGEYITKPGTYEIDTKGIVMIAAPNVILENSKINAAITLPVVENGEIMIKNSTVKEDIIVSGDVDALKLIGSTAQGIIIENKVERLTFEGKTSVSTLIVNEGAKGLSLSISSDAQVEDVMLKADDITVENKGSISNIFVDGNDAVLNTIDTKITTNEEVKNIKVNGTSMDAGTTITVPKADDNKKPSNNSSNEDSSSTNTYYTVSFDTGIENININKQSIKNNTKVAQPEVEMIREGYIFEGWYNGSEKWDFTKDIVRGNMTLTAKWSEIVKPLYEVSDLYLADGKAICFHIKTADGVLITADDLWKGNSEISQEPKGKYIITVNWLDKEGKLNSAGADECYIAGAEDYLSVTNNEEFKDDKKKISNITVHKLSGSEWKTNADGSSNWVPIIESTEVLAQDSILKETAVEEIELSDKEITIEVGEIKKVKAVVKPIMATNQTITRVSNDENVATVKWNGEIKGIAPGETTITYTAANGMEATCKVTVKEPEHKSLYKISDLYLADTNTICFSIETVEGTRITGKDIWTAGAESSTEPKGEYIITVNWIDKDGDPNSADADEIYAEDYLSVRSAFGFKDDKKISNITVHKLSGSEWKTNADGSSNWVPVIESTEVLAQDSILKETAVEEIELSDKEITIEVGEIKKVKAVVKPIMATNQTIMRVSNDENVATVKWNGEIKGIALGETTITYTAANGVEATCKVVVEAKEVELPSEQIENNIDSIEKQLEEDEEVIEDVNY